MTYDEVNALRKGAIITRDDVTYQVTKVAGLKHANLRYRKIWFKAINGTRDQAFDGDQMVGKGWSVF